MQTTQLITDAQLDEVIEAVYAEGRPIVREAYSDFDCPTETFPSASDLRANIEFVPGEKTSFHYALYFPDARGFVLERRIELNAGAVQGHTHRFSQEGWGLVFLQIDFRQHPRVECCVTVNSAARARNWFTTYPHLKSPDLWDWKVVDRHAGRLVRLLRKLGKQVVPVSTSSTRNG